MSDTARRYRAIKQGLIQFYQPRPTGHLEHHLNTLVAMICGLIGGKHAHLPTIADHAPSHGATQESVIADQKSRGFHLHKSHVSDPARVARLVLAACLAYLWVVYLGACAIRDGWVPLIHRGDRCDLSLFRLGLRFLARCLKEDLPIPDGFLVPEVVPEGVPTGHLPTGHQQAA